MATAVVFDLISALADAFRIAIPTATVYDGQGASDDPGNFLMVGVGDPNSDDPTSASGELEWAGLGHRSSYEHGTIACSALAWSGDSGDAAQKAARETVRDLVGAVEVALRTDPNLGGAVPGLTWVRYGRGWNLDQSSNNDGVQALFRFEVAYEARLTS
jgi:hypothetical protein